MLDHHQLDAYRRDGFCVIPDFVDPDDCAALRERALHLVDEWEPGAERSVFTTDEQTRASTREFLDSASRIWCFFEEGAVGPDGELARPKRLAINKIGHAQHDLDPVFERFTYTDRLAEVAHDIGLADPLALQSMYIFKQPGIGGEVGCHQDSSFLFTEPLSVIGFWFAIEDATVENGCMWAEPGGHLGPLRTRFELTGAPDPLTHFVRLDDTPLPDPPHGLVPIEATAGTLVVLHGLLPHWSDVNRSDTSRHAYTVHCISASAEYPTTNWLQRTHDVPLRRLDQVTV